MEDAVKARIDHMRSGKVNTPLTKREHDTMTAPSRGGIVSTLITERVKW